MEKHHKINKYGLQNEQIWFKKNKFMDYGLQIKCMSLNYFFFTKNVTIIPLETLLKWIQRLLVWDFKKNKNSEWKPNYKQESLGGAKYFNIRIVEWAESWMNILVPEGGSIRRAH